MIHNIRFVEKFCHSMESYFNFQDFYRKVAVIIVTITQKLLINYQSYGIW